MRACVLFNPRAGSAGQLDLLRELLLGRPGVTVLEPGSGDELVEMAAEAARGGYDLVAVAGGDGSVHAVVNGLMRVRSKTPLAVLPLGTGNDLCRTLAVPLDLTGAVAALDRRKVRRIDVIKVDGATNPFAVNAVTGGFSGQVARDVTKDLKATWGPLAYLRGAAGPIIERAGYRVTVRLDGGKPETFDLLNVVVANGRTAAGGVAVAPRADPEDGKLDVLLVRHGDFLDLSVVTARLLAGTYHADETVVHRTAKRVEIESDPPLPVSVDGELTEGRRFVFEAVRRALPVVVGPGYHRDARKAGRHEPVSLGRRLFGLLAAAALMIVRMPRVYLASLVGAVLTAGLFGLLARGVAADDWRPVDERVLAALQRAATPARTDAARVVTAFGDVAVAWAVAGLVGVGLALRRRYLDAVTVLAVIAGCGLIELGLKPVFGRDRPVALEAVTAAGGFSFPSGHALRGGGLYGCFAALLVLNGPRRPWRWAVAAGLAGFGLLIAASRLYLGVHWLTDVIGGGLAAVAWVTGCLLAR
ncbi:MAG: YegS/Rv2252/BmrU family lipid kinase, partial [Gemmataceae bacterium]